MVMIVKNTKVPFVQMGMQEQGLKTVCRILTITQKKTVVLVEKEEVLNKYCT